MPRKPENPTLMDLLDERIQRAIAAMNCVGIGTIQAFNATNQTATVTINYKRVLKDAAMADNNIDTVDVIKEYPKLIGCPVVFLGGGVARLTFPVASGDTCIVFFNDRDMDTWLDTGIKSNPPNSERIHSLTDAIAMVGISSKASPIEDFNTIIASLFDKTGERLSQAGDIKATARTTAPSGWLLCYGQAISRTTYDVLFTAIGTTYGAGDGSTTFNVPDLRGRTIVGLDNMGGSSAGRLTTTYTPNKDVLGGGVGEEAHQLTIKEMPAHTHDIVIWNRDGNGAKPANGSNVNTGTYATNSRGGDVAHNTVQPGMMLNWIIKI